MLGQGIVTVCTTLLVVGSMRETTPATVLATHTACAEAAMPETPSGSVNLATTLLLAGSTRTSWSTQ